VLGGVLGVLLQLKAAKANGINAEAPPKKEINIDLKTAEAKAWSKGLPTTGYQVKNCSHSAALNHPSPLSTHHPSRCLLTVINFSPLTDSYVNLLLHP
jgi:hypothetical protein